MSLTLCTRLELGRVGQVQADSWSHTLPFRTCGYDGQRVHFAKRKLMHEKAPEQRYFSHGVGSWMGHADHFVSVPPVPIRLEVEVHIAIGS